MAGMAGPASGQTLFQQPRLLPLEGIAARGQPGPADQRGCQELHGQLAFIPVDPAELDRDLGGIHRGVVDDFRHARCHSSGIRVHGNRREHPDRP